MDQKYAKATFDFYFLTYTNILIPLTLPEQNIFFLLHSRGSSALTWILFNCYLSTTLASNSVRKQATTSVSLAPLIHNL